MVQEGMTPLHWAAFNGDLQMVKWLVAEGASVGVTDNVSLPPILKVS
jgi:ankyrin repeat protein